MSSFNVPNGPLINPNANFSSLLGGSSTLSDTILGFFGEKVTQQNVDPETLQSIINLLIPIIS